jgi:gamma-glutamyltranspeptidase/glutathione hydrolase
VAGCSSDPQNIVEDVDGIDGVFSVDEPRAGIIAREVLSQGGSAADAAVAAAFAMSVTLPSRVGLGGGGVCIAFSAESAEAGVIDFPIEPRVGGALVPGMVLGLDALQARYGRQRWSALVAPAEKLARFGFEVSRAFAQDAAAAGLFRSSDGSTPGEGELFVQEQLADVLSAVRREGPNGFYRGTEAEAIARAAAAAGNPLTASDLAAYHVRFLEPIAVDAGRHEVFTAPPPVLGGVEVAQLWLMAHDLENYSSFREAGRKHLLGEASARVFADRANWRNADGSARSEVEALVDDDRLDRLMADYESDRHVRSAGAGGDEGLPLPGEGASLAVIDRFGDAVACSFGLNGRYGSGQIAPGTGVVMPAVPEASEIGAPISPLLVANRNTNQSLFAGAASGGGAAVVALVQTLLEISEGELGLFELTGSGKSLPEAVAAPRVLHRGSPDILWVERRTAPEVQAELQSRGHNLRVAPIMGILTAVSCLDGMPREPESCQAAADPRAFGLARRVE